MDDDTRLELMHKAVQLLEDAGEEAEVRPRYSGRGMYGENTAAIVSSASPAAVGAAWAMAAMVLAQEQEVWPQELMSEAPTRFDNMGAYQWVVY